MAEEKKIQDHHDHDHEEEEKEETLATPGVLDKYQQAGKIANDVLKQVITKCVPNALVIDICKFGDKEINTQLSKVYNNKRIEKGIAFPVCISVNEICGHFSPLQSEQNQVVLIEGDVVKIDLGVHIDGYIAQVAHTVVIQGQQNIVQGRKAEVILAAQQSLQAAFRKLKPGNKNSDVTQIIQNINDAYKCNAVEGVLSHELKKHLIDGNNVIINKETYEHKVEEHEFQVNEVYVLDLIISSGEGKPKETEIRTSVFKRALEKSYTLKTKHGRTFFNDVIEKYPTLCFTLRGFDDEISAKVGVADCLKHDLLVPYPVLTEKKGEIVAQFKFTVAILQSQTQLLCGLPFEEKNYQTDIKLSEEITQLLNIKMDSVSQKAQRKKENEQKK